MDDRYVNHPKEWGKESYQNSLIQKLMQSISRNCLRVTENTNFCPVNKLSQGSVTLNVLVYPGAANP